MDLVVVLRPALSLPCLGNVLLAAFTVLSDLFGLTHDLKTRRETNVSLDIFEVTLWTYYKFKYKLRSLTSPKDNMLNRTFL